MKAKSLSVAGEEKALRYLLSSSRSQQRDICHALRNYCLTPVVERALQKLAENCELVAIRKAARRALLDHWRRSRREGQKEDAAGIGRHLAAHGIAAFFHLTARANLPNIERLGGLLSRRELSRRAIAPTCIAEPGRDDPCGTDEWVHLCFHPNQPMFYSRIAKDRHNEFVVLEIKTEVALWAATVFSSENAVAGYAKLGPTRSDLDRLNLACFADGIFTLETKAAWQAEVLVHPVVPLSAISGSRLYSEVLSEHQRCVPMGAKLEYLNRKSGQP